MGEFSFSAEVACIKKETEEASTHTRRGEEFFAKASKKRPEMKEKRSWEGFEEYRDRLFQAARRSLETDKALEAACTKHSCDPLSAAISGFTSSKETLETSGVAKEAGDNASALLEIVRIQGELVGKHGFDTYFVQR